MRHIKETLQSRALFLLNTHSKQSWPVSAESIPGQKWEPQPELASLTPAPPRERLPEASLRKNDKMFSYLIHLCCWVHSRIKAGKTQVRNSILLPFIRQQRPKPRFLGSPGSSKAPVALPFLPAALS